MEGGINRGLGDEGLLDNRWNQALATCRLDSSHKRRQLLLPLSCEPLGISGTININLQKGRSGESGSDASLIIKSTKIWRERRRRRKYAQLELLNFSSWGVFLIYTRTSPCFQERKSRNFSDKISSSLLRTNFSLLRINSSLSEFNVFEK